MAKHTAAIHVLKARLKLDDDAYRDLLGGLVGKRSCSAMSDAELVTVRGHLERLVTAYGLPVDGPTRHRRLTPEQFAASKKSLNPQERKVWALWSGLAEAGLINDKSASSLDAYVGRQVHVSALRFCTRAQINTLIESLKAWLARAQH